MTRFSCVLIPLALLWSGAAFSSDIPNCHDYCAGRDLYTNGYKVCVPGEGCYCDYSVIHDSPRCAGSESTPGANPNPKKVAGEDFESLLAPPAEG